MPSVDTWARELGPKSVFCLGWKEKINCPSHSASALISRNSFSFVNMTSDGLWNYEGWNFSLFYSFPKTRDRLWASDYRFDSHSMPFISFTFPSPPNVDSDERDTSILNCAIVPGTAFQFRAFVTCCQELKIDFAFRLGILCLFAMKNKNLMDILLHSYVTCGWFNMLHGASSTDEYLLQRIT